MKTTLPNLVPATLAFLAFGAVSLKAQPGDPCYRNIDDYINVSQSLVGPVANGHFSQSFNIQNKTQIPVWGTFWLVFEALPSNVTVENRTGLTKCGTNTLVKPFVQFKPGRDGILMPGEATQISVEFYAPAANNIKYQARVYAGTALKALPVKGDYDGDGRADLMIFRHPTREFHIRRSTDQQMMVVQAPMDSQSPILGDFDGDGKADPAVMLWPSRSFWVKMSSTNIEENKPALATTKLNLTPADFDGDGKTDIAVYDRAAQKFLYHSSKHGAQKELAFAMPNNAVPAPADYDGDGKDDAAYYDHTSGDYKYFSSALSQLISYNVPNQLNWWWVPMPGDFNGDGRADLGIYAMHKGIWSTRLTSNNLSTSYMTQSGMPLPFDYDGDGKADRGIYSGATHKFYVQLQSGAPFAEVPMGIGDGDSNYTPTYVFMP